MRSIERDTASLDDPVVFVITPLSDLLAQYRIYFNSAHGGGPNTKSSDDDQARRDREELERLQRDYPEQFERGDGNSESSDWEQYREAYEEKHKK